MVADLGPGSRDADGAHEGLSSASLSQVNRHAAGAVMQTDYAGQTVPVIDPATRVIHAAQIFVAVLGASNLTFAFARGCRTGSTASCGRSASSVGSPRRWSATI
jgi:hypothetical protein